jgi:uncharacterized protein YkwD
LVSAPARGGGWARSILPAWLSSAGHRKSLLDRFFRVQVWVDELGYRC